MQLKFNKSIVKRIVSVELETINFTGDENKMLDEFGEPELVVAKVYTGDFPVDLKKKIRTGFKINVKFDGTTDLAGAVAAANLFFEEVQVTIGGLMATVAEKKASTDFTVENGILDIKY